MSYSNRIADIAVYLPYKNIICGKDWHIVPSSSSPYSQAVMRHVSVNYSRQINVAVEENSRLFLSVFFFFFAEMKVGQ